MSECMNCGLPQTKNPHPEAGRMSHLVEVGSEWGCLPCANKRARQRFEAHGKTIEAMENLRSDILYERGEHGWSKETQEVVTDCMNRLANEIDKARQRRR